jgi:hypothetical protein
LGCLQLKRLCRRAGLRLFPCHAGISALVALHVDEPAINRLLELRQALRSKRNSVKELAIVKLDHLTVYERCSGRQILLVGLDECLATKRHCLSLV